VGLGAPSQARGQGPVDPRPGAPSGAADPLTVAPPSQAERRQLTVMFVDLVGSTALAAKLDPEEMSEIIRAYQNVVAGEITRFGGHVAKYMGDGVLAYFGWPKAHEDDAERAVRAGLAITDTVPTLGTPADGPLAARVGIASGLVVVGDLVGEGAAQEEAVVGETPNLAARLQQAARAGTVLITEPTRKLLGEQFALEALPALDLKGVETPVVAHTVRGERTSESRFAARAGGAVTPMVSRDEELSLLVRHWRLATAGEGQAVLILGEAGIGKSRLLLALEQATTLHRPVVMRYQCSPFHRHSAFWPLARQLAIAAGPIPGAGGRRTGRALPGSLAGRRTIARARWRCSARWSACRPRRMIAWAV
jgi:class 3 adenylate cyclase